MSVTLITTMQLLWAEPLVSPTDWLKPKSSSLDGNIELTQELGTLTGENDLETQSKFSVNTPNGNPFQLVVESARIQSEWQDKDTQVTFSSHQTDFEFRFQSDAWRASLNPLKRSARLSRILGGHELGVAYQKHRDSLDVQVNKDEISASVELDFDGIFESLTVDWSAPRWQVKSSVMHWNNQFSVNDVTAELSIKNLKLGGQWFNDEAQLKGEWQTTEAFSAFSQIGLERYGWNAYGIWNGHQLQLGEQRYNLGWFTEIDVNDPLLAAVGEGTYWINALADVSRKYVTYQTQKMDITFIDQTQWNGTFTLTQLENHDARFDLYEPLLLFGLPILSNREVLDVSQVTLGVIQPAVYWTGLGGQWTLAAKQIVPINIEYRADVDETSEIVSLEDSSNGQSKNAGLFWPGASISLSAFWRF